MGMMNVEGADSTEEDAEVEGLEESERGWLLIVDWWRMGRNPDTGSEQKK